MRRALALALGSFALSACATMDNWRPTVDRKADPHPETIDQDLRDCRELAQQTAEGGGAETAKSGAKGAAGGAAVGAALGAIGGAPGTGAAAGAVVGGVGSSVGKHAKANQQFKDAFIKCMEGRGHKVLD